MNTFHLTIASVGQTRFDGAAVSASVPGRAGDMTILPHHEPLITTLKVGFIRVKLADGSVNDFPIEGGLLECTGDRVVALL